MPAVTTASTPEPWSSSATKKATKGEMIVHRTARRGSLSMRMMRGISLVKIMPHRRPAPAPAMMPAVMMTRMVADRMRPRNTRFMRTSETDNDSQYSRKGRKIVRTIIGDNYASAIPGMKAAPTPTAMRTTGPMRLNRLVSRMQNTAAMPRMMIVSTDMESL